MILSLFQYLAEAYDIPNIFRYISFRAASAGLTSFILSLLIGNRVIAWLHAIKFGQSIRSDGPQSHLAKAGTPTMGGLLILITFTSASLLWNNLSSSYTWICLLAIIGYGALGFLDDYLKIKKRNSDGVSPLTKILGQVLMGLLIVSLIYIFGNDHTTKLYIPFLKDAIVNLNFFHGSFYIFFIIILLTASSNAVNLTDGLDGLATGLMLIALIPYAIIAYILGRLDFASYLFLPHLPGASELSVTILALIGSSLGFLWYNSHPAQIMMGDTGSLAYGAALGTIATLLKKELLLFVIGGVFVLETLSVIIQVYYFKRTGGKRVFLMAPLHHHFEMKGWHENQVVNRFWILGAFFAVLGLLTLKTR